MSQPSPRELRFLKSLAERTGQTFTYPKTSAQAPAEIDRLKHSGRNRAAIAATSAS